MWPKVWTSAFLALGAGALVPWVAMAFQPQDIEAVESPLLLAVAHEVEAGPHSLYGPYDGRYPLVLIHAPLYYRLAAVLGWLLYRAGFEPVVAALAGGRLVSAFGFLVTLAAASMLARLGGMPRRAGAWAALLVAGTPIFSGVPFEVRPDMLGIGIQTSGILFVLAALAAVPIREARLMGAAACFAVAICIKQQYLIAPLLSVVFLTAAQARGRLSVASIARFVAVGSGLPLLYYGGEEWITRGQMSRSVFVAALKVGQVHPADWLFAANSVLVLVWKCVGPILLLAAAGLAMVSARRGRAQRGLVMAGAIVIGAVAALAVVQFFVARIGISALLTAALLIVVAVIIPACFVIEISLVGDWLDWALWGYFAAEMVFTTILWRLSTGGWFNYAIEAVVIGCVLTARALARAFERAASWRLLIPAVAAAVAVAVFAWTDVRQVLRRRDIEAKETALLLKRVPQPASQIFFVDLPGANRLHGRRGLVYDPWLYPVFESIDQAEPRSLWLEEELATGVTRYIATISSHAKVNGVNRTLPELGYSRSGRVGPYFLWARHTPATQ
jgi:hypothetical protein